MTYQSVMTNASPPSSATWARIASSMASLVASLTTRLVRRSGHSVPPANSSDRTNAGDRDARLVVRTASPGRCAGRPARRVLPSRHVRRRSFRLPRHPVEECVDLFIDLVDPRPLLDYLLLGVLQGAGVRQALLTQSFKAAEV